MSLTIKNAVTGLYFNIEYFFLSENFCLYTLRTFRYITIIIFSSRFRTQKDENLAEVTSVNVLSQHVFLRDVFKMRCTVKTQGNS